MISPIDPTARPGEQNVEPTKASWSAVLAGAQKLINCWVCAETEQNSEFRQETQKEQSTNSGESRVGRSSLTTPMVVRGIILFFGPWESTS